MRCRLLDFVLLLLTLAPVIACGDLPRPFAPPSKPPNDLLLAELLRLEDRDVILVQPAAGPAALALDGLATAMAAELTALGIPTATGREPGATRLLTFQASLRPMANDRAELVVLWELHGLGEETLGRHATRREVPIEPDGRVARPHIAQVAAEAAVAVARIADPRPIQTAGIPGFPGARLIILPLADAPGDAAASLPRALAVELKAASLPLADAIGEDDLLVLGTVDVTPPRDGLQEVDIRWLLVRARGDAELGEIAQRSRVPAGSLNGPWGPVAQEVARGAAAGMIDLLQRVGANAPNGVI